MQKLRIPFTKKFQSLSDVFKINPKSLNDFLKGYEQQYINSATEMQNEKFSYNLRDNRTVSEYLYDLCEGWIMEDLLAWKIQQLLSLKGNYQVKMNGCEVTATGRKIITSKITSKSDLVIMGNQEQKLEIQFANRDRDTYDIKETKIKEARREKALIFVYSLPLTKGFLIDPLSPSHMNVSQLESNAGWGGKQAYKFHKRDIVHLGGFISLENLVEQLIVEIK